MGLPPPDPPSRETLSPSAAPVREARADVGGNLARRFVAAREASVLLVLLLFLGGIFFSSARATFFSPFNMQNLLRNIALLAIFAIGETIVIITAGIDLSLGSLIAFSGMILAYSVNALAPRLPGFAVGLAILIALAVSLAIGAVHAGLIHYLRLPPFVVTLASLTILRSQAMLLNKELPISIADFPFLGNLANGRLFPHSALPIPIPVLVLAFLAIVTHILLSRTR
ncbi:MAG TPA: ABC transporter permease, partial [Chthonomonadaceae bacterium]|nr:ABC transporter permease [Chthonomonadaceae bacterium]